MNSFTMRIIKAFSAPHARLRFTPKLWGELCLELSTRGQGRRESGAFLLTPKVGDGRTVTSIVYLDDLDPRCLVGGIHFDGMAYRLLHNEAQTRSSRVIADVHTHPSSFVNQSDIDQENPMVPRAGHISLIVPNYATPPISLRHVGVHEYLGNAGWHSRLGRDVTKFIYIGRWA